MKKVKKKTKKAAKYQISRSFKTSKVANFNLPKVLAVAQRLLQEGKLQQAEQNFHQILSLDPENIIALYSLSCIEYQTGRIAFRG